MTRPRIVTNQEWEGALERLRAKEKELTSAHDQLAAERRRLPAGVPQTPPYQWWRRHDEYDG